MADDGSADDDDLVAAVEAFCLAVLSLSGDAARPDPDRVEALLERQWLLAPLALARAAELVHRARQGRPVDRGAARERSLRRGGALAQALTLLAVGVAHGDDRAIEAGRRLATSNGFRPWFDAVLATPPARGQEAPTPAPEPEPQAVQPPPVPDGPAPASPGLTVQLFGGFGVSRSGGVLDLGSLRPRHLELLQLLAVNANRWMHRETLWELLWSDRPPEAASHNLHVAISAVRRTIDPGASRGQSSVLRRSGDRYRLEVRIEDCDVCRFEHHVQQADEARRGGDLERAASELGCAVREWQGEPVPAAGPADWAVARRDELRRRFAAVAVDVLGVLDPTVETSTLAARAVAIEPADDLLWRHAIDHARRVGAVARLKELETAYGPRS